MSRELDKALDRFVQEWGRMSSNWGINRTMAQIHALLFVTSKPFTMDEICDKLAISRGNASMSLRGLIDWGVIKRSRPKGERHDYYQSDTDAITMVAQVLRERKRREFDPTLAVLQTCLNSLPHDSDSNPPTQRINELLAVFETVDLAYNYAMLTDERFRYIVNHRGELRELLEAVQSTAQDHPLKTTQPRTAPGA